MVKVVPTAAVAVDMPQGVKPTTANICAASQQESVRHRHALLRLHFGIDQKTQQSMRDGCGVQMAGDALPCLLC